MQLVAKAVKDSIANMAARSEAKIKQDADAKAAAAPRPRPTLAAAKAEAAAKAAAGAGPAAKGGDPAAVIEGCQAPPPPGRGEQLQAEPPAGFGVYPLELGDDLDPEIEDPTVQTSRFSAINVRVS